MTPTEKSRKAIKIIVSLSILVIIAIWLINGAELEDAWLYFVAIAIVLTGIPFARPSKDSTEVK